jgi:asparaginyl-tRNA synthetase
LVEKHFESPVVLFDYPKEIKAFYMRLNEDGKTVAAWMYFSQELAKLLVVHREERLEVLKSKMNEMHVDEHELWWYLDTRKFGSVPTLVLDLV